VDYTRIEWLPLCVGLAVLGLVSSWLAWRHRGAVAGLRGAARSLIPLAAYLTGVITLFWQVGAAVTRFAVRFVFSPTVWVGVITTGISAVLFVTAGVLRRRGIGSRHPAVPRSGPGKAAVPTQTVDDDMAEIEALLQRRGIK
jgi:hypothetical protein